MTVFNIQEFISRFTDMIPYELNVKIGGRKADSCRIDATKRSRQNYEGKLYQFNIGDKVEYRLAQDIPLDVDIKVLRDPSLIAVYDSKGTWKQQINNPEPKTKRDGTSVAIRLFDRCRRQVGFITIQLNAAGDISHETYYYQSSTGAHTKTHSVDYDFITKQQCISCDGYTEYTEKDLGSNNESVLKLYQTNGVITAISYKTQRTLTRDEILCQSLTDFAKSSHDEDTSFYLCRCVSSTLDEAWDEHKRLPYESNILESDLLNYRRQKKLTLDPSYYPKKCARWFVEYIENPENDLLHGFVGEYIGNTFVRQGDRLTLCVHTVKDGNNLYTLIDLTGTDPFIGSNPMHDDEERDSKYFDRIKKARKIPLFITRKFDRDQEKLIAYDGSLEVSIEGQEEFEEFAAIYIRPFEDVKKMDGSFVMKMIKPKMDSDTAK